MPGSAETSGDRKSTRLNSSHSSISYAVFCLKKKNPAITPFVEGWQVPLELRVLAHVTPDHAPFVVASVVTLKDIEDNIIVPTIFFFNDTATTEIYTLSLHDALPI